MGAAAGYFAPKIAKKAGNKAINYKQQLLDEQQGMIDKIKGIKSDYDEMIKQSKKITEPSKKYWEKLIKE